MGLGAHYMWHRASDLRARRPLAPGGSAAMSRNGFTLIELLIVVVIIGLLATIAIPKFSNTKEKAFVGTMKSDLRNLDRKSTRLNSSHSQISYAVFCLKKKKNKLT